MTEESRPAAQDAQAANKAMARAPSVGRRAGLCVYLLALVYITTVSFISVTRQIFAPPDAEAVNATRAIPCDEGARTLARDLRVHATAHVEGTSHPRDQAFFEAWDRTYGALAARCDEPKFLSLARLRHRIEITLRRFDREEGAAFARLTRGTSAPGRAQP